MHLPIKQNGQPFWAARFRAFDSASNERANQLAIH